MSVASEITRINTNIANAYTQVSNKGGTLPATQNSNNLANAIASISGGLSGLEYEEGTYKPTSDTGRPFIEFQNQHNKMPMFIQISYCEDDFPSNTYVNYWAYIDIEKAIGKKLLNSSTISTYVEVLFSTIGTTTASAITNNMLKYSSDNTTDNNVNYPRYYAKENGFYPGVQGNNFARFAANKTYKWIAIWK